MNLEALAEQPYWIIDILPAQVPPERGDRFFAVEKYFLAPERLADIKRRHISLLLKLSCWRDITPDGEGGIIPAPACLADRILRETLLLRAGDALILSEPDDTHMTVFRPDRELLALIRQLAAAEGLFVWEMPGERC